MLKKIFFFILILFLFIISSDCAHQVYPTGGPVDLEPPKIVDTYPIPNSLNVNTNKIHFEFDEYVDRSSFEKSVYISPSNPAAPEYSWSGKEIDILLPYELKKNKTYTITIGTDVVDVHNKNRMADAYTLAFSTGNEIDSGFISGKIYDEKEEGLLVFAYKLDSLFADTLDPSRTYPDYTTQSGRKGEYSLKFLSNGKYRVFAVKDEYRNLLYDSEVDKIGMAISDQEINKDNKVIRDVNFKLALFDTTSPKLYSAEATDNRHVLLKFSKNINASSLSINNFSIMDSVSSEKLTIEDMFMDPAIKKNIKLLTGELKDKKYLLSLNSIMDSSNHPIDPDYSKAVFSGVTMEDTLKPIIQYVSIKDSLKNFSLSDPISIRFNDFMKKDIFERSLKIIDTNKITLKLDYCWDFNSEVKIKPIGMKFNSWYKLEFPLDSLIKYNNKTSIDSTIKINFLTENKNDLSSLSGIISNENRNSDFVLEVTNIDKKNKYHLKTKAGEKFKFDNISEGRYTLFTFIDSDSNGAYSYGNPQPFKVSEKFFYPIDTIKVKARWPVEDIKVLLK
jgi:hypothetical protein